MGSQIHILLVIMSIMVSGRVPKSEGQDVPVTPGLSYTHYASNCPNLESIIQNHLNQVFQKDITQAAGLLRLHFHDCFVQGCDASVLLDGSASGPSEQDAPPNLTLRKEAFEIIEDLRALVHEACGRVVSCADITALAARDSVVSAGGPNYDIPLGRKDSITFASEEVTLENLPPPSSNTTTLLNTLGKKGLDATDLVSLSGAHTIGRSHCSSFNTRLYPTQDTTMDQTFAMNLKQICPNPDIDNTDNTVNMDIRSPNKFDNKYYVDLMNRQGLFTSDQDLYTDSRTRSIVTSFAVDQNLFFQKFVVAMLKMGQFDVLTRNQGEIRADCSLRNNNVDNHNHHFWSVFQDAQHRFGDLLQF